MAEFTLHVGREKISELGNAAIETTQNKTYRQRRVFKKMNRALVSYDTTPGDH